MPLFSGAIGVSPLGDGRYAAELGERWTVGPKAHGGLLMVLLGRAGVAAAERPDALVVAADFLRAPEPGPVELTTEVVKEGRTATVVAVRMHQAGQRVLSASVTAGTLPEPGEIWAELPDVKPEPPADATAAPPETPGLPGACEVRLDPATVPFLRRESGPPVIDGWVRPRDEQPDVWFGLLAGDVLPPVLFNLGGRFAWAPTVQMTAFLRGRPAPGWLRVRARTAVVGGGWFDEDATVVDAAGRLVCQTRQLALAPKS